MAEPYLYTDIDKDQLLIGREADGEVDGEPLFVVVFTARDSVNGRSVSVHVPLADVELVVGAIRTAAGQDRGRYLVYDGKVHRITDMWRGQGPTSDSREKWGVVTKRETD